MTIDGQWSRINSRSRRKSKYSIGHNTDVDTKSIEMREWNLEKETRTRRGRQWDFLSVFQSLLPLSLFMEGSIAEQGECNSMKSLQSWKSRENWRRYIYQRCYVKEGDFMLTWSMSIKLLVNVSRRDQNGNSRGTEEGTVTETLSLESIQVFLFTRKPLNRYHCFNHSQFEVSSSICEREHYVFPTFLCTGPQLFLEYFREADFKYWKSWCLVPT